MILRLPEPSRVIELSLGPVVLESDSNLVFGILDVPERERKLMLLPSPLRAGVARVGGRWIEAESK